jgi:flagellar basal body-associated protein FliL
MDTIPQAPSTQIPQPQTEPQAQPQPQSLPPQKSGGNGVMITIIIIILLLLAGGIYFYMMKTPTSNVETVQETATTSPKVKSTVSDTSLSQEFQASGDADITTDIKALDTDFK